MFVIVNRYDVFFSGYEYDERAGERFSTWELDVVKLFLCKELEESQIEVLNKERINNNGPFTIKEMGFKQQSSNHDRSAAKHGYGEEK